MSKTPSQRRGSHECLPAIPVQPLFHRASLGPRLPLDTRSLGLRSVAQSRALDRVLLVLCCGPALAIAAPIALVNWLRYGRLDKVLFLQERVGLNGGTFTLWKFRTLSEALDSNGVLLSDGKRATRFSRFLRSTHLDELPQIMNVLRGEMSFIGPRPEMVSIHAWACAHIPDFASRLVLRPGITGLAQITQGYATQEVDAYTRKAAIDQDYILRRSLRFDVGILAMTAVWMLQGRGWQWKQQGSAEHRTALKVLPSEFRAEEAEQTLRKAA